MTQNARSRNGGAEQVHDPGFAGKGSVRPNQIAAPNEFFAPGEEAIAHARRIVAEFEAAGTGRVVTDGTLSEKPTLSDMHRIVAITDRMGG
ncbi:MAG: hypothetical protein AB3N13_08545 [Arenibacterium sp.]